MIYRFDRGFFSLVFDHGKNVAFVEMNQGYEMNLDQGACILQYLLKKRKKKTYDLIHLLI